MANFKCPICENEEINQEDNYCMICGYKFEKQKIAEIVRDKEGVSAKVLTNNTPALDILTGMAILAHNITSQTGKDINEVLGYIKKIYENCKIEEEDNQNASK